MTYMVVETHMSYSVVLDEAGRFLKVANMQHEVGQVVEQVVPMVVPKKKAIPLRLVSAAGAVAACFALMFFMYWNSYMSPFASIYLTINPEVRMQISKKDTVVGLEGVNEDGVRLVEGYAFRGKSMTQATDDLLDRAIDMGFLSDGGMVSVNIDAPDEAWFESTGITLRQSLNDHLAARMVVTIEVKQYAQPADPAFNPDEAQKPTAKPAAPATPPAASGDSGYGDSGYGESSYGDSGYGESSYGEKDGDSGYSNSGSDSGYSGYAAPQPAQSGNSGYGDSAYNAPASSDYGGNSAYSDADDDGGDSGYQAPDDDDSGYGGDDDD